MDVVQLHGSESPEYAASLSFPVLKAIPADSRALETAASYPDADILLDSPSGGGSGSPGTSHSRFRWSKPADGSGSRAGWARRTWPRR